MTNAKGKKDVVSADVIEARCIRLVDSKGKRRVELSTSQTETGDLLTVIQIFDEKGLPRIELSVAGDEAGIRITDKSDGANISLATRNDGSGMSMQNAEGTTMILAGTPNDTELDPSGHRQSPRLELHDLSMQATLRVQDEMH